MVDSPALAMHQEVLDGGDTPIAARLTKIMVDLEAFADNLGESDLAEECDSNEIAFAVSEAQQAMLILGRAALRIATEEMDRG